MREKFDKTSSKQEDQEEKQKIKFETNRGGDHVPLTREQAEKLWIAYQKEKANNRDDKFDVYIIERRDDSNEDNWIVEVERWSKDTGGAVIPGFILSPSPRSAEDIFNHFNK
ncbi:MAG: hypothetical protein PHT40_04440 [Patescibacteria group bacterium]|nr:hypothetical protein [Patescibacteria group bacterium]